MAALLQGLWRDGAAPRLQQQRDRQVVPLEGLDGRLREQRQADRLERGGGWALPLAAIRVALQKIELCKRFEQGVRHPGDLRLIPAQEQFRGNVRIHTPHQPLDIHRAHARVAHEGAGEERGHRKQMQDVVAVVRGQHRIFRAHPHDVAEGMLLAFQHAEGFRVGHDLLAAVGRHRDQGRVRRVAQQALIQLDLAHQVHFGQRLALGSQNRHRHQIDRRHRGGRIDFRIDAHGEIRDRMTDPAGAGIAALGGLGTPMWVVLLQQLVEVDGLPQIHMDCAEFTAQNRDNRPEQNEYAFLLFRLSRQFADVGPALHDAFIAEVNRHEFHRPFRIAQVAAQRHRQHTSARREQPSGSATPALDEVLERMTARHHEAEVLGEHHRIERIALEAAAQEEGATLAQKSPDQRHVEIRAGGDVRNRKSFAINDVRQQQVVHVAAVARHIDDFNPIANGAQVLEVLEFHAVVQRIPQAAQRHGHESDKGLGIIRGDFQRILARQQQCGSPLQLAGLHLIAHGLAHGLGLQDLQHHGASMREVGTDARGPLRAQDRAQRAQYPAHAARFAQTLVHDLAQAYRLAEIHQGIAAIEYHAQDFAKAPDQNPIFGERQAPPADFLVRRAAPKNRHWHKIYVKLGVSRRRIDQLHEITGRARRIAAAEQAGAARQFEVGPIRALAAHHQAPRGPRQIVLRADVVEHGEIGVTLAFQHIAHRTGPRRNGLNSVLGLDGGAHPQA